MQPTFRSEFQANTPKIEIFENEGKVYVKSEAAESPHELALKHCKPCVTGFEALKAQAEAGEDGGLFALAVKQTEEAQRALGQVAQPGPGPLSGLSPNGDLRLEETVSRRSKPNAYL